MAFLMDCMWEGKGREGKIREDKGREGKRREEKGI
jgi:hypothetical protein